MSRWDPLLVVQQHDTHADQLIHRAENLPLRAQLRQHEDTLANLDRRLAEVESRRVDLTRSQQRFEDEIGSLNERANQAEKKLYSGSVSNPRELQALQDDIASIRKRIAQIEDDELEVMELLEPVEASRAELMGERERLDGEGTRMRASLAEAEAEIEAELAGVRTERAEAAAAVAEDMWPTYERLRKQLGGVAIARLVGSTCQGCHLALPAAEVDRIRHLSPDEPVNCEECGRLLVRE